MNTQSIGALDWNNPLVQKISKLKTDSQVSVLMGDYKTARMAYRELAQIGADNFELVAKVPNAIQGSIPLFSKFGLRVIGYNIFKLFHRQTPEEKRFKELGKLFKNGNLKI